MSDNTIIRTFLAVDLPDGIKEALKKLQNRMKEKLAGVRWTRPEGIHLTLKFFGDIPETDIVTIAETVEQNTKNVMPFKMSLGTIGAFPNLKKPRVLWLGIHGEVQRLQGLQKIIDETLEGYGFPREERGFKPHLTLGRMRFPGKISDGFKEALIKIEKYSIGSEFTAEGLTLFRSELKPTGAEYTELAYFPFEG